MKQKNILFLMTDQQRLDHWGAHPDFNLSTPNLDFIGQSAVFTDCFSVNPLCTPARCAVLTGRYAHQVNMRTMSGELDPAYKTYSKALQEAGYRTACIGKTHWWQGWSWFDGRPESHYDHRGLNEELKAYGFDRVWECWSKNALGKDKSDYTNYLEEKGYGAEFKSYYQSVMGSTFKIENEIGEKAEPFPFDEQDYLESVVTRKVIEEFDNLDADSSPLFVFGSYFAPHEPYDPPPRFLAQVPYEEVDDFVIRPGDNPLTLPQKKQLWKCRQAYKALILMLDEQVGKILDALRKNDQLDNTVILFTSDHGDLLGDHGCTQKGLPFKQSVNVPGCIRHPDFLENRSISTPIELTDFTATILEIAGLDPQQALSEDWPSYNNHIPCRSLMPLLRGETDHIRDHAFSECDMKWHNAQGYQRWSWQMLADSEWKYIRYLDRKATCPEDSREEWLIDRRADPQEILNLADEPEYESMLSHFRKHLDFLNDTTPTAQTNWIPYHKRNALF